MDDLDREPGLTMTTSEYIAHLESERDQLRSGYEVQLTKRKDAERQLAGAADGERARIAAWLRERAEKRQSGAAWAALVNAADDLSAAFPRTQHSTEDR